MGRSVDLKVVELSKSFGPSSGLSAHSNLVLQNLHLEVRCGEFIAIVGRSGCGKSTLLRLIAGLEQPTQGHILIDSNPVQHLNPAVRMMFQDARLLPWKPVLQNVGLGLRGNWQPQAKRALEQVGLADRGKDWIAMLSGGQRQRVALARALVSQPGLLLLDEPLGALDALTRIEMQRLIETIWQAHQFTTVLITHDVEEAVTLGDRVLLLESGQIVLDLAIPLARPRDRGDRAFTTLVKQILDRILMQTEVTSSSYSANANLASGETYFDFKNSKIRLNKNPARTGLSGETSTRRT